MTGTRMTGIGVLALATGLAAGCVPSLTIEDVKAMRPERPAELDKLEQFAGRWEWKGEARLAGLDKVLTFSGRNDASVEGDGWYLVSREVGHMEELGETKGMSTWGYDTRSKKFRTTWVDSMGSIGTGTAWYDAKADVWHLRANTRGPLGSIVGKGRVKFPDPNTMEWSWTDYAMGGLVKTMELRGTSKRM